MSVGSRSRGQEFCDGTEEEWTQVFLKSINIVLFIPVALLRTTQVTHTSVWTENDWGGRVDLLWLVREYFKSPPSGKSKRRPRQNKTSESTRESSRTHLALLQHTGDAPREAS